MLNVDELSSNIEKELFNTGGQLSYDDKTYDVRELYGVFGENNSFQFALEEKECVFSTYFYNLYNAFDQDCIITTAINTDNNKSNVPWRDNSKDSFLAYTCYGSPVTDDDRFSSRFSIFFRDAEGIRMLNERIRESVIGQHLIIRAIELIPSHLIFNGRISRENLALVHYATIRMLGKNPDLLDSYFSKYDGVRRKKILIPHINLALMGTKLASSQYEGFFQKNKNCISLKNLYGIFGRDNSFEFGDEQFYFLSDGTYKLVSPFNGEDVSTNFSTPFWRAGRTFLSGTIEKIGFHISTILPPELIKDGYINLDDLQKIQRIIKMELRQHPELIAFYYPQPKHQGSSHSNKKPESDFIQFPESDFTQFLDSIIGNGGKKL